MIFADLPSPAEAGFAKAGSRFPLFGIMRVFWRMILSDLPSPAEAGFAKAGNRFPLFGIMRYRVGSMRSPSVFGT
jgi:hypothetical protein